MRIHVGLESTFSSRCDGSHLLLHLLDTSFCVARWRCSVLHASPEDGRGTLQWARDKNPHASIKAGSRSYLNSSHQRRHTAFPRPKDDIWSFSRVSRFELPRSSSMYCSLIQSSHQSSTLGSCGQMTHDPSNIPCSRLSWRGDISRLMICQLLPSLL